MFVDPSTGTSSFFEAIEGKVMEDGYKPGVYDVICGRGKRAVHHPGNTRFRLVIMLHLNVYQRARTKMDKSLVVIQLAQCFKSVNGLFVKENAKQKGQWMEIGGRLTREKIGHALRDTIMSRSAEGRSPEDIERFSQTITIDDIMRMSPSELMKTEQDFKFYQAMSRPNAVKSVNESALTSKETLLNKNVTSIAREFENPLPSVSKPSYASRQVSDGFAPIKLEDIGAIDESLLQAFLTSGAFFSSNDECSERRKSASSSNDGRRDSEISVDFSVFDINLFDKFYDADSRGSGVFTSLLGYVLE